MSKVSVPSNDDVKPKTGPNPAAASALLEDYYYWLLRTGKLIRQPKFAPPKQGAPGKSVSVVTAKNSSPAE